MEKELANRGKHKLKKAIDIFIKYVDSLLHILNEFKHASKMIIL